MIFRYPKNKIITRLLLIQFFMGLNIASTGKDVLFTSLGIEQGLSHPSVHSIYQDENGTMWFGTRQGLNRYNGGRITPVVINPRPEDMVDNTVWTITGDYMGSLILLVNRNILKYDQKYQKFEILTPGIVDQFLYVEGNIWYASGNQLYTMDPDVGEPRLFTSFPDECIPVKQIIRNSQGAFWLATKCGLLKISSDGVMEKLFFRDEQVTAIMEDSNSMLWVGTRKSGAFRLNPHNETYSEVADEFIGNEVRCFAEDEKGEIWLGTFNGLYHFNKQSGIRNHYLPAEKLPYTLSHSSIYALYQDAQRSIWVGTYFGGVNYFNPGKDIFKFYASSSYHPDHLSFPIIGNMTEDNNGNLWICTEGGGLNKLNRADGKISVFKHSVKSTSIGHNNLKFIWYDQPGNRLFIGTHLGGLSVMDLNKRSFTTFLHNPGYSNSLPDNVVNRMAIYKDELLLATQKGIASMNLNTGLISPLFKGIESFREIPLHSIWDIYVDSKERLWIAYFTSELFRVNLKTGEISLYQYSANDLENVPRSRIIEILEDSRGNLWFTTDGSGIMRYNEETDNFNRFTVETSGLISDYCFKLGESISGDLIITSNKGVTFFNPEKELVMNIPLGSSFPLSGIIEENEVFVASDGEIFVGGYNGMVSFFEEELETVKADYKLFFTSLQVNNVYINPGDGSEIMAEALPWVKEIKLKHHQTHLTFSFASSNYIRHSHPEFEYILEGFDENWIKATGGSINYSTIPPGSYILRVRERNPLLPGTPVSAEVRISVTPAWYASTLAYMMYILFLLGIFIIFVIFDRNRTMLKASLEFERKEKDRIEELNQSKLRFFTNISHEFRTPLTLIISLVEMIVRNPGIPHQSMNLVMKIQKHALRMRHLVNELLDFNKQEQGLLQLKVSRNDLVAFLNDIYHSFTEYALSRNIGFVFDNSGEPLDVWFDPIQMQKVFYNLLSNAFKFTPPDGEVRLRVIPKSMSVVVKVYDTGKGIPVNDLSLIFDRFHQAENIASDSRFVMSSGIGLALSKGIVEMHGGTIGVESKEGEGSIFRVELPLDDSHFSSEQKDSAFPLSESARGLLEIPDQEFMRKLEVPVSLDGKKPSILLVEDNEDILQLLVELFNPIYNVFTAGDGEEGYAKTLEIIPDIVLSDVMMARMSGREMCRKIKSKVELSHIPVVLLTSLTSPEQISEGYIFGADDYVSKPFDAKTLIVRCNNLVNSRRLLRERFSNLLVRPEAPGVTTASDQELMKKVDKVIDDQLENPDFNIDILARETGVGRSKLYSRVREITGMTPNTYLLSRKMQKAVEWMRVSPHINISEIGYKLGFNSARYFSLCFKDHYGASPNDYKRKLSSQNPENQL